MLARIESLAEYLIVVSISLFGGMLTESFLTIVVSEGEGIVSFKTIVESDTRVESDLYGKLPGAVTGFSTWAKPKKVMEEKKSIKLKWQRTLLRITVFLGFSENFTNLHKVIANSLNID